jgi:hypothetical protein
MPFRWVSGLGVLGAIAAGEASGDADLAEVGVELPLIMKEILVKLPSL